MKPIIRSAAIQDIAIIQDIAAKTWPSTFGKILSTEQIQYMLQMMYSETELKSRISLPNHVFYLLEINQKAKGFLELEFNYNHHPTTKIHKIYILPNVQGQGLGKKFMNFAVEQAKSQHSKQLILNVNKYNPAISFYENIGFNRLKEEVIDIGQGYVMDDYVYVKSIS